MEIKREVTVNGAGLLVAQAAVCGAGFTRPLADHVHMLHVFPSVGRRDISAAPALTQPARADVWETASYLALWGCGLLGIGLSLMSW